MTPKTLSNKRFTEYAREKQILWLKPKQVAALMQCSPQHVYDLAKSGRVSYIKDGKNVRFKPEDLDDYEEQSIIARRKYGTVSQRQQF